jgi:hypothetical protein
MARRFHLLAIAVLLVLGEACAPVTGPAARDEEAESSLLPIRTGDAAPAVLLTGWIWPIDDNEVRTLDFAPSATRTNSVELRNWKRSKDAWQSLQAPAAGTFAVNGTTIVITTSTGRAEHYRVLKRSESMMVLADEHSNRNQVWYNCRADGWPPAVLASVRSCTAIDP